MFENFYSILSINEIISSKERLLCLNTNPDTTHKHITSNNCLDPTCTKLAGIAPPSLFNFLHYWWCCLLSFLKLEVYHPTHFALLYTSVALVHNIGSQAHLLFSLRTCWILVAHFSLYYGGWWCYVDFLSVLKPNSG